MNIKVLSVSALVAVSGLIACNAGSDNVGTGEQNATSDIDHMFKRPDGKFDVWCSNGTSHSAVTAEEINSNMLCGGPGGTTSSSSSSSGATSSSSSSSGATSSSSSSSGAPVTDCASTFVPPPAAFKAPGAAAPTACSGADIDKLVEAFNGSNGDWKVTADAVTAQNAACATCVFTDEAGTNWGPVVTTEGGTKGRWNNPGCWAVVGGSEACGSTFNNYADCGNKMCSTCTDDPSASACFRKVASNAQQCGQYNVNGACGGQAGAVNNACKNPLNFVVTQCGGADNKAGVKGTATP